MNNALTIGRADPGWHGPGAPGPGRRNISWQALLWALVFPLRRHRISFTVPGVFLMGVSMGIGTAAYNTASNILFITLSLLLACLLLSGLLSWFNFMGVSWRMRPAGPWRAGHETLVSIEMRNGKSWLPTYGLWLDFALQPRPAHAPEPAREMSVREALKAFERSVMRGRTFLRERIEPQGELAVDWGFKPAQRGEAVIELVSVGSLFPFGFLRKNMGAGLRQTVLVWPAQVEYQWREGAAALAGSSGRRSARSGTGDDLLALRKYAEGDSHRLIHWKASARLGQLMVRQFAAESPDGFILDLEAPAALWSRPGQFELLCSLAGTMAEDLFAAGRLQGFRIGHGTFRETRRVRDVEAFLNELARFKPAAAAEAGAGAPHSFSPPVAAGKNVITFTPDGARGVLAHVDRHPAASA